MVQTKQEIRNAWNRENLKHYNVVFHKSNDIDLIEYVEKKKQEGFNTSDIFRLAIETMMKQESGE